MPRTVWSPALQEQRIARIADWSIADWSLRVGDFATSDPLEARIRGQIRNLCEKRRRTHLSGASEANFEVVPGPAQFQ
eukprot:7004812-Alexandrium_andersonii.AAC.1